MAHAYRASNSLLQKNLVFGQELAGRRIGKSAHGRDYSYPDRFNKKYTGQMTQVFTCSDYVKTKKLQTDVVDSRWQ